MIARLFRFCSWFVLILLPALACALEEAGTSPVPPAAQIVTTPPQATPAKSEPKEPATTPATTVKPATSTAQPVPVNSATPTTISEHPVIPKSTFTPPAQTSQAMPPPASPKPAASQAAVPKPIIAPVITSPTQPANQKPAFTSRAASAPAQVAPKKPVQTGPAPQPAPSAQTLPNKTATTVPATKESTISPAPHPIDIEVFIREECTQCDKAKEFLTKLHNLRPQLKIVVRDVRKEPAALELLKRVAQNQGDIALDYPAFVVGGQLIIGFSEEASTAQLILDNLSLLVQTAPQAGKKTPDCESIKDLGCGLIPPAPVSKPESINFDILGYKIPLLQIGLPLFTITMGMLDGFNHSSTWVLILMLSLLAPMKNRSAMFTIAGTYIATQGIIYYIILSAWFRMFFWTGTSPVTETIIALIALVSGAFYLKKYMFFGQHISISSEEITKPGIYTRIRKILQASTLTTALLGTIAVAILVQLSEITYKSLFPALYTRVLTLQQLDNTSNYAYLLLYDLSYMLDDIIILAACLITLKQERTQTLENRTLKLISGLTMFGLATYLLYPHIDKLIKIY